MIVEPFSRPVCHLREEARKVLLAAAGRNAFELIGRNLEDKEQWESQFGQEIPVVFINGRKAFKNRVPHAPA